LGIFTTAIDGTFLDEQIRDLSMQSVAGNNEMTWNVEDAPTPYVERLKKVFKMSQDMGAGDQ
jgi:hypothetical protein